MSVYASKRSESKVEFLRVAQQLAVYTLKQTKKFPKSYRFNLTNDIVRLSIDVPLSNLGNQDRKLTTKQD